MPRGYARRVPRKRQKGVKLVLADPKSLDTAEGILAFFKMLTGREATQEEIDELRQEMAKDAAASKGSAQ
jgi:hypothetical protein